MLTYGDPISVWKIDHLLCCLGRSFFDRQHLMEVIGIDSERERINVDVTEIMMDFLRRRLGKRYFQKEGLAVGHSEEVNKWSS